MKDWHPAVVLVVFAAMLVLVAGGTFLLGRSIRANKSPTVQQPATAVAGAHEQ